MDYRIVSSAEDLNDASKVILPGVGSFDHAAALLEASGMKDTLNQLVLEEKIPALGICVGMQLLANTSEEGTERGLGWIDGTVKRFPQSPKQDPVYLPHMGWNDIEEDRKTPLLDGLPINSKFYFLHSYYFECAEKSQTLASTDYSFRFSSVVNKENIFGVQFHPEKSHDAGGQLLANFGAM